MRLALDLSEDFTFADATEMLAEVCQDRADDLVAFYRAQYLLDESGNEDEEGYAGEGLYQPVDDPVDFVVSEGHSLPGPDYDGHLGRLGEMFNASGWGLAGEPYARSDGSKELLLRSNIDGYLSATLTQRGDKWELQFDLD